jgi:hypothetical protein
MSYVPRPFTQRHSKYAVCGTLSRTARDLHARNTAAARARQQKAREERIAAARAQADEAPAAAPEAAQPARVGAPGAVALHGEPVAPLGPVALGRAHAPPGSGNQPVARARDPEAPLAAVPDAALVRGVLQSLGMTRAQAERPGAPLAKKLNHELVSLPELYRALCAALRASEPSAGATFRWAHVFARLRNAAHAGGHPTSSSHVVRKMCEDWLLPYLYEHPEDALHCVPTAEAAAAEAAEERAAEEEAAAAAAHAEPEERPATPRWQATEPAPQQAAPASPPRAEAPALPSADELAAYAQSVAAVAAAADALAQAVAMAAMDEDDAPAPCGNMHAQQEEEEEEVTFVKVTQGAPRAFFTVYERGVQVIVLE